MTLKEKQKQEALKRMQMLQLMNEVRKDFKESGRVYYSERQNSLFNAVLYWIDNNDTYTKIVKDFEKKHNALVYHCQLSHLEFGDCLSLLYVSAEEEEWQQDNEWLNEGYPLVYVVNLDNESYSEFGTIGVRPSMGGIVRTA